MNPAGAIARNIKENLNPLAADLTARLVAIDSVNPELVAGGAGEREIAAFVADWARDAGLEVTELAGPPGRPSVLARAPNPRLACRMLDPTVCRNPKSPTTGAGSCGSPACRSSPPCWVSPSSCCW